MRDLFWTLSRCKTSWCKPGDLSGYHDRVALEFTLFTFCPPGPGDREKVNSNSLIEIEICSLTKSNCRFLTKMKRLHNAECAIGLCRTIIIATRQFRAIVHADLPPFRPPCSHFKSTIHSAGTHQRRLLLGDLLRLRLYRAVDFAAIRQVFPRCVEDTRIAQMLNLGSENFCLNWARVTGHRQ
jgi:hypothetical protein